MSDYDVGDRLLRLPDVEKLVALRRSAIYKLMAVGRFPIALKPTGKTSAWKQSEILEWVASLPRAGGGGGAE